MPATRCPFLAGEIEEIGAAVSPVTGKQYGIERVCEIFQQPRSSFYAQRCPKTATPEVPAASSKRGPKTDISDEELVVRIKADLEASPFHGEGHRKVWARLRVQQNLRVSRHRVLRLMREQHLLSPFRAPKGDPKLHDGHITTQQPNEMWGTDGSKILTVEDGYVWLFVAVEHWNTECVGWHVSKSGSRFEALEPVAMGVNRIFGTTGSDVARGLSLRMDHGTQYLSDHFVHQVRFWGIQPSYAFVREPETNGVAERFIRTVKEQAIYGRIFRTVEEVRAAVAIFVENYNRAWPVQKLGYPQPVPSQK